jgi:hypothetical protein
MKLFPCSCSRTGEDFGVRGSGKSGRRLVLAWREIVGISFIWAPHVDVRIGILETRMISLNVDHIMDFPCLRDRQMMHAFHLLKWRVFSVNCRLKGL